MSKYKQLKKEHDKLKEQVAQLLIVLESNGSIGGKYGKSIFPGSNGTTIKYAQVDANNALFRINMLLEHLGLELKHIETNEWKFVERKKTDE